MTGSEKLIAAQWHELLSSASREARLLLSDSARQQATVLSRLFYSSLLKDPQASVILSSEEVENRLNQSLQQWVIDIFGADPEADITPLLLQQRHIGMMHSRVNVTIELVLRGARLIKSALMSTLLHGPQVAQVNLEAAQLAVNLVDIAIEAMAHSYSLSREKAARTDEAFRSYAATVNVSLERERQRSALFDWSNRLLQDMMIGATDIALTRVGSLLSASGFVTRRRHSSPTARNSPTSPIGWTASTARSCRNVRGK